LKELVIITPQTIKLLRSRGRKAVCNCGCGHILKVGEKVWRTISCGKVKFCLESHFYAETKKKARGGKEA